MTDKDLPVIEVKGISKKYLISHEQKAQYGSLRDNIAGFVKKPFEKSGQNLSARQEIEEFWALKDVSFNVNKGEIFGIVGRNGSGKSTLLKTLSRIISPTKGEAIIRGRTASLLEVGTGFHPELTGRENIYFNGSMLGMSKSEISSKFNEIVEFAEIHRFLDTPVKFYSSGMYVRLAFSVAAHLEPDVLILDEVLAVGDANFQKKSMKKILSTMEQGTTVLFVSHSMDSVRRLCSKGIILRDGEICYYGEIDGLVNKYSSLLLEEAETKKIVTNNTWSRQKSDNFANEYLEPLRISVKENDKEVKSYLKNNVQYEVVMDIEIKKLNDLLTAGYCLYNENNMLCYMSLMTDTHESMWPKLRSGKIRLRSELPKNILNEGSYKICMVAGIHNKFWILDPESMNPSIDIQIKGGLSESPRWTAQRSGLMAPVIKWSSEIIK